MKQNVYYVDLIQNQFARCLQWLLPITSLLPCVYILPKDIKVAHNHTKNYDDEYVKLIYDEIADFLKSYGKIIYLSTEQEIEDLINSNTNNYLFYMHPVYKSAYKKLYKNKYIFIHHGFDNRFFRHDEIYANKQITQSGKQTDYNYTYNDKDTKIYNTAVSDFTRELSINIDKDNWNNIKKPVLGLLLNRDFEEFLLENRNNFNKLAEKYSIIVRPHPRISGVDVYNRLSKVPNFIVDTNITFIPIIDKSDIVISFGLTSILEYYVLWKKVPLLLIYDGDSWRGKNNHYLLSGTNKIINSKCCFVQHQNDNNIIFGVEKALEMDKEIAFKHRLEYINNYFHSEIENGNQLYLDNILNYKKVLDSNFWTAALGVIFHNLKRSWVTSPH